MDNLNEALTLLKGQLGDFDNIKLLLGAGDMTHDAVASELLKIAQDLQAGTIAAGPCPDETEFKKHVINL